MTFEERPVDRAFDPMAPMTPTGAPEWEDADPFFDVTKDVSVTECTGLMPALAQDEFQGEMLSGIQSIHRIKGQNENN